MPGTNPADILSFLAYDPARPFHFLTGAFVAFLLVGLFFFPLTGKRRGIRVAYLLLFSLYFYYRAGGAFVALLILSALIDFQIGRVLDRRTRPRPARLWLWTGISLNLLVLVAFKYTPIGLRLLAGLKIGGLGLGDFVGPVGISFYVLQKISYLIDVYRCKTPPAARAADFLLYVAFFPRVLAGPIIRAGEFFPQLAEPRPDTERATGEALGLILTGLFKKAVIADYIGLNFVDRVFAAPGLYSGVENLLAVYGYALQVYCDFSGYTDMALGIARLFGFRLPQNFRTPYKSACISEFWRRWHITLSEWLRDYLFLPIANGLSRRIRSDRLLGVKTEYWLYAVGSLVTWLVCGLWHGAAWGFIIWGLLHGAALTLERLWKIPQKTRIAGPRRFWNRILSFHFICLTWIFFRAGTLEKAGLVLARIFIHFKADLVPQIVRGYPLVMGLIGLGFLLHFFPEKAKTRIRAALSAAPLAVQSLILAVMLWVVLQVQSADIQPFIYFKF